MHQILPYDGYIGCTFTERFVEQNEDDKSTVKLPYFCLHHFAFRLPNFGLFYNQFVCHVCSLSVHKAMKSAQSATIHTAKGCQKCGSLSFEAGGLCSSLSSGMQVFGQIHKFFTCRFSCRPRKTIGPGCKNVNYFVILNFLSINLSVTIYDSERRIRPIQNIPKPLL